MPEKPIQDKSPAAASTAFAHLLDIMATLRSPNGCPWDAQQTPESLKPYLLEETYEVLDALDRNEPMSICDELGDLLLQIVFHARIFEERGLFTMTDVSNAIVNKLIRRHPHVFADNQTGDKRMLAAQWDRIKTEERRADGKTGSLLGNIPRQLPALQTAQKLAAKTGPLDESQKKLCRRSTKICGHLTKTWNLRQKIH